MQFFLLGEVGSAPVPITEKDNVVHKFKLKCQPKFSATLSDKGWHSDSPAVGKRAIRFLRAIMISISRLTSGQLRKRQKLEGQYCNRVAVWDRLILP